MKFSGHAVRYCRCMGVDLLGWKYPRNNGLENIIEKHKLYPITILPSLRGNIAEALSENRIMMASDLFKFSPQKLALKTGISLKNILQLIKEAEILKAEA